MRRSPPLQTMKRFKRATSTIAHIGTHNAYHVGQIVYIRNRRDPGIAIKE